MPGFTCPPVITGDIAYVRFHGSTSLYSSYYSDKQLSQWAEKIIQLKKRAKTIYVYFNNDSEAFAVKNATTLTKFINIV